MIKLKTLLIFGLLCFKISSVIAVEKKVMAFTDSFGNRQAINLTYDDNDTNLTVASLKNLIKNRYKLEKKQEVNFLNIDLKDSANIKDFEDLLNKKDTEKRYIKFEISTKEIPMETAKRKREDEEESSEPVAKKQKQATENPNNNNKSFMEKFSAWWNS